MITEKVDQLNKDKKADHQHQAPADTEILRPSDGAEYTSNYAGKNNSSDYEKRRGGNHKDAKGYQF